MVSLYFFLSNLYDQESTRVIMFPGGRSYAVLFPNAERQFFCVIVNYFPINDLLPKYTKSNTQRSTKRG